MNTESMRKLRRRLFDAQNGFCHWCKKPMVWVYSRKGKKIPPEAATVDHVYGKLHPMRKANPLRYAKEVVAACNRCNRARARSDNAKFWREINQDKAKGANRCITTP